MPCRHHNSMRACGQASSESALSVVCARRGRILRACARPASLRVAAPPAASHSSSGCVGSDVVRGGAHAPRPQHTARGRRRHDAAAIGDVSAARGPMGCEGRAPGVQGWVRWCARVESSGVWGGVSQGVRVGVPQGVRVGSRGVPWGVRVGVPRGASRRCKRGAPQQC